MISIHVDRMQLSNTVVSREGTRGKPSYHQMKTSRRSEERKKKRGSRRASLQKKVA